MRTRHRPTRFPTLPALAAATGLAALAGCYDSHPTPLDGDRPDVLDGRSDGDVVADDGDGDEASGAYRIRFDSTVHAPASRLLWLEQEATTDASITLRLMVDADADPVFGVAARSRWDASRLALRDVRSCGPFDRTGRALLEWRIIEPGSEAWLAVAAGTPDDLVATDGGACAMLLEFDILGPGTSVIELIPGRSAAVGSPPTRYVTVGTADGVLEVTR